MDGERRITSWNVGAERLLGYSEQEILGQTADLIFTPEDRANGAPEREAETAATKGRAEDERWHRRKDGTRFWSSGLLMPLRVPAAGFCKILRDRTAQHEAERTIADAQEKLSAIFSQAVAGI